MHKNILITVLLIISIASGQEYIEMSINELFDLTVCATPSEYVEIRAVIIRKATDTSDFQGLIETQESKVYAALAQAMLQRYKTPDIYTHYDELLGYAETVAKGPPQSRGYNIRMFERMLELAQFHNRSEYFPENRRKPYGFDATKQEELSFVMNKPDFIPFWVEASLKNENNNRRVYALGRLAGFDMPISQQTFLEVVSNPDEVHVQVCAVDLITEPSYLPYLHKELEQWKTSEKREKQLQAIYAELKKNSHETAAVRFDRQKMRRIYFSQLDAAIIRAFKRMNYTESIDLLKIIYTRPDEENVTEIKEEILDAFTHFNDPNTLPFLCQEFEKQPNPDIVRSIGNIDINTYLKYLESKNTNQRYMCVMAALYLNDKKIILPMARIANSDDRLDIRRHAVDRIANFKIPDSIEPFQELLIEEWGPEIRQAAVTAIGRNGLREGVQVLKETVQNDPDPNVRMAALEALEDLNFPEAVEFLKAYEAQTTDDEMLTPRQQVRREVNRSIRLKQQEKE